MVSRHRVPCSLIAEADSVPNLRNILLHGRRIGEAGVATKKPEQNPSDRDRYPGLFDDGQYGLSSKDLPQRHVTSVTDMHCN